MKILSVIILFAFPAWLLAEPADQAPAQKPDPLPASAKKTMEKYDKAMETVKRTYDTAARTAAAFARKDLEQIIEVETKAGRLESAMAVKLRLEQVMLILDEAAKEIPKAYQSIAEKLAEGTFTEAEWKALPGQKVNVDSRSVTETKIVVKKGEAWLVAPNPGDKWFGSDTMPALDYLGDKSGKLAIYPEAMRLEIKIAKTTPIKGYLVEEEGEITLNPKDHYLGDNKGTLSVKILRVR
jgi:hypothetical protein